MCNWFYILYLICVFANISGSCRQCPNTLKTRQSVFVEQAYEYGKCSSMIQLFSMNQFWLYRYRRLKTQLQLFIPDHFKTAVALSQYRMLWGAETLFWLISSLCQRLGLTRSVRNKPRARSASIERRRCESPPEAKDERSESFAGGARGFTSSSWGRQHNIFNK